MFCVFCAIVSGETPAVRIYEDDDYLAILDIRPFTRGHTLVIPKRHTVDLTDTRATGHNLSPIFVLHSGDAWILVGAALLLGIELRLFATG